MDKPTKHHSVYFTPPSGTTVYGVLGSKGRVKGQTRAAKERREFIIPSQVRKIQIGIRRLIP